MIAIRSASDGSFFIPRPDAETEEYLDSKHVRLANQLRWVSRIPDVLDSYGGIYLNQTAHIVGKGPSLDVLKSEPFVDGGPIFCINESIHKVESLSLVNPLYCVQLDNELGESCKPEKPATKIFVSPRCGNLYGDNVAKVVVDPRALHLPEDCLSAQVAIVLAQHFGCNNGIMHCFDGCTGTDYKYAKCIGYDSAKGGAKIRFKSHRKVLVETAAKWHLGWRTPTGFMQEAL